ncbi:MAG: hypothetical protein Q8O31_04905 [Rhodocyclaceae bacterium]|nr:hypothetical protein [Rhodocyclaceae bacterium]
MLPALPRRTIRGGGGDLADGTKPATAGAAARLSPVSRQFAVGCLHLPGTCSALSHV